MAKDFSFSSYLVPAKSRAKSLQGASVSGNIVANVSNVGVKTETAATVVNNYITNNYIEQSTEGQIKGDPITITDLLALTDMHELDFYQVFNSGSESSGWVFGDKFTLNDQEYDSGSFVQYTAAGWQKMDDDIVDLSNNAKFNPLQDNLVQIEELYQDSSIPMLSGATYNGIALAKVRSYKLDDDTIYQKNNTQSSGERPASTNRHILFVPYASKNGTTYSGGALSAADYKKLCELESGGGGNYLSQSDVVTYGYSGTKIATIGTADINLPTPDYKSSTPSDNDSFYGHNQEGDYICNISQMWNYIRNKGNIPYIYTAHASNTVPTSYRFDVGMYYGKDGVWYYDGNMSWKRLATADEIPDSKKYIKFYQTSSSSTLYKDSANGVDYISAKSSVGGLAITISGLTTASDYRTFLTNYRVQLTNVGFNEGNSYTQKKNIDYAIYVKEDGDTVYLNVSVNLSSFIAARENYDTWLIVEFMPFA